jgi:hypothetical protein
MKGIRDIMCQTKSQGGKRCLRHQAATNAEVKYAWAKTGVDTDTIYGILKELNKEGRKLDAPELAEVNSFLNMEEFKVKADQDPRLTQKEKKVILKNLNKAREEAAKQGVTGGAFHAWKNVFSKTVEKMKRPVIALGVVGAMAFSLAGCTGAIDKENNPIPTSSPSASAPTTGPLCDPANDIYGDVVPTKIEKDERGEYCHVGIDPKAEALNDESKIKMNTLEENGISKEQALAIQKKGVTFAASEGLDSTILDRNTNGTPGNDDNALAWVEQNKDYFDPSSLPAYQETGAIYRGNLVINGNTPQTIRDGKPRLSASSIALEETYAKANPTEGQPADIVVLMSVKAAYRVSDEETVNWLLYFDSSRTEESVKAENPELFDGSGENNILLEGKLAYSYSSATEKLNGNSYEYMIDYKKTPGL